MLAGDLEIAFALVLDAVDAIDDDARLAADRRLLEECEVPLPALLVL